MKKAMTTMVKRITAIVATFMIIIMTALVPAYNVEAANASNAIAWGIDVSMHNGGIDWGAVAASGAKFVFIKAGSAKSGMDPNFVSNITGANAAGLKVGVYLYTYATNAEQATNEANALLGWIAPYTVSFPVVLDIENSAQAGLGRDQIQAMINAYCGTIAAAGYYPVVYSSKSWFNSKLVGTAYDKWVAQYNDHLEYDGAAFWQSTSHGSVSGVSTRVDIDYQFKDYSQIIISDGFVDRDGGTRFYAGYKMQRGWVDYAETRYHINDAGFVDKNMWFNDETGTYFLQGDGSVARGQVNLEGVDYYFDGAGHRLSGWVALEKGLFFYAPDTAAMVRGWYSDTTGIYYLNPQTGAASTGLCSIEGNEYWFADNGIRMSGWLNTENGTYFYAPDTGIKVKGWYDDASGRHYLSTKDGHMLVGDVTIENQKYYFGDDGIMKTGLVVKPDGNTYYYDESGAQIVNTQIVVESKTYDINKNGVVTEVVPVDGGEATATNS